MTLDPGSVGEEKDVNAQLARYITLQTPWEKLPGPARALCENNQLKYANTVVRHALQHRLQWKGSLVQSYVPEEKKYYEELLKRSRTALMLYPYHLSEPLAKLLRATPFAYYRDIIQDVMLSERSYDSIPNFTAADGVRLLGIGRNEYIDIMNKFRARGSIFKKKTTALRELLPTATVFKEPDYWWLVNIGATPTEDELRQCDDQERATLTLLDQAGPRQAGTLDKAVIVSLHKKGLVFLTTPVRNTDLLSVPPLENFVMNRVQGDYFENLLYDIFVSIDERTTVEQIAEILQANIEFVRQAVAIYLLLGIAKNKSVDPKVGPQWHKSWAPSAASPSPVTMSPQGADLAALLMDDGVNQQSSALSPSMSPSSTSKRVGFIFDSTLTAFLMMGNLGAGLKMHAVTMFEVGKLPDETMDEFLSELAKVVHVAEGEAQRYADHAICLRNTIKFLRKNPSCPVSGAEGGLDLLRCERLNALDRASLQRVLSKNYGALISMAPISAESPPVCMVTPPTFGPPVPEANSLWMRMFLYSLAKSGPPSVLFVRGSRVRKIPTVLRGCKTVMMHCWGHEGVTHSLGNLLPVLNSKLQQSAVLVQAYSYTNDVPETFDVALPYVVGKADPSPNDAVVRSLVAPLGLDRNCGYLRLTRLPGTTEWVADHVSFGIPIFSLELNAKVCELCASQQLFCSDALVTARESARDLAVRLLDFISKSQCPGHGSADDIAQAAAVSPGSVLLPSRHVVFANGRITQLDA